MIRRAYDLKKIVEKVAEIYGMKLGEVFVRGRQRVRVGPRIVIVSRRSDRGRDWLQLRTWNLPIREFYNLGPVPLLPLGTFCTNVPTPLTNFHI